MLNWKRARVDPQEESQGDILVMVHDQAAGELSWAQRRNTCIILRADEDLKMWEH